MLRQQERLHQCRMVSRISLAPQPVHTDRGRAVMRWHMLWMQASWLSAIVPTAPLAVLPVPNIPMYYAGDTHVALFRPACA